MKLYKVYYINLDKSTQRREFMENQFQQLNVPINKFPAIYGKNLAPDYLKKAKRQHHILTHFPYLNDGEIGLTKTYFELWKVIANQKEEFAIILEDDALICTSFFDDLKKIIAASTTNDFIDISGRKGFFSLKKKPLLTQYLVPALQTTGQIIGKNAAKILSENLHTYYAPIDVLKQDVFKHKVKVTTTNKIYVTSNDKNIGGTTIQQKSMPKFKKIVREIIRPFWQILTFFTYKFYRCIRNYHFYKRLNSL